MLKKEEEKDVSTESSEGPGKGVEAELKDLTTSVEWRRISSVFLRESRTIRRLRWWSYHPSSERLCFVSDMTREDVKGMGWPWSNDCPV